MTIESYTGQINTGNNFSEIGTLTGVTLTTGTTYTIGIKGAAEIKIADAIFYRDNEIFQYTHGSEDISIRSRYCVLTILENETQDAQSDPDAEEE